MAPTLLSPTNQPPSTNQRIFICLVLGYCTLCILIIRRSVSRGRQIKAPKGRLPINIHVVAPKKVIILIVAEVTLVTSVGALEVFAKALTHLLASNNTVKCIMNSAANGCFYSENRCLRTELNVTVPLVPYYWKRLSMNKLRELVCSTKGNRPSAAW